METLPSFYTNKKLHCHTNGLERDLPSWRRGGGAPEMGWIFRLANTSFRELELFKKSRLLVLN